MENELLLKILQNGELSFFESRDRDHFTLGSEKIMDDVYLSSPILSSKHLFFQRKGRFWHVTNKSDLLNVTIRRRPLKPSKSRKVNPGRNIEITDKGLKEHILIAPIRNVKSPKSFERKSVIAGKANCSLSLTGKSEYYIGRSPDCDIVVDNPQVDEKNTRILFDGFDYYIEDLASSSGTCVNGESVRRQKLVNYDFISIPTAVYLFQNNRLIYATTENGIDIDVVHVSKTVQDLYTRKPLKLIDDISLSVKAGEFVAVVGGSGAGKSTILDCVNGRRPATEGGVFYDRNNYYRNLHTYQSVVGYVPQRDIMHDNLTVEKALYYYAAIRMRSKLTKPAIVALTEKAMKDVSLLEKRHVKISSLSGGQKKRVSIAMELLADPKVIFLDEPTSGLSPDLDYEIMNLLYELSKNQGRTIVVITHSMENVDRCDKIAFLGKGGRLCYYGTPKKIFSYFGQNRYSAIFSLMSSEKNSVQYAEKWKQTPEYTGTLRYFTELYEDEVEYEK